MVIDIFEDEQKIYDAAQKCIELVRAGEPFNFDDYLRLVHEYGSLLRQLRRSTRIADKTAFELHGRLNYDGLTGIYNRRYMEDNLKRILKSLARSGGELSLLMIDIDFFKLYNDTYGHSIGDECLKSIALCIAGAFSRPDDFAARYGGEEFAVILPGTNMNGARHVAEKLLLSVRTLNIPHKSSSVSEYVTVSIGATSGIVSQAHKPECYIKRADKALYMSKNSGRARYTYLDFDEVQL